MPCLRLALSQDWKRKNIKNRKRKGGVSPHFLWNVGILFPRPPESDDFSQSFSVSTCCLVAHVSLPQVQIEGVNRGKINKNMKLLLTVCCKPSLTSVPVSRTTVSLSEPSAGCLRGPPGVSCDQWEREAAVYTLQLGQHRDFSNKHFFTQSTNSSLVGLLTHVYQ